MMMTSYDAMTLTVAGTGGAPPALGLGARAAPGSKAMLNDRDEAIAILLIDDDPDCRLLIRDAIGDCNVGNAVYEVASGEQAIAFLSRTGPYADAPRPGLIFLDIEMPGMDGQAVLQHIRGHADLRDVPVVMMTGVSDPDAIRAAAHNGANSYTVKPASADAFLKTVLASTNYWLRVHQYPRARTGATPDPYARQ